MVCCPRSQTRATPSSDGSRPDPSATPSNPIVYAYIDLTVTVTVGLVLVAIFSLAAKPYNSTVIL